MAIQHAFFESQSSNVAELNIVMDLIPMTVARVIKHFSEFSQQVHPILTKVYMYQLFRVLNYLRIKEVLHRDIKPQNLLVDPSCHIIKLCDFGSAKKFDSNEKSVSYICSRYYRAPELMFGARNYTYAVDMWAAGCVMGELITGEPLFKGKEAH